MWFYTKPEANETSHLIHELTYKVTYEFRIQAINDYGIGPWSTSVFQAVELGSVLWQILPLKNSVFSLIFGIQICFDISVGSLDYLKVLKYWDT